MLCGVIYMENHFCNTCMYYRQHYTFNHYKIFRVHCGHCTYSKVKRKHPDSKACESYEQLESTEGAFVSKEYLSKSLLEYMLNLELLPEIYNEEDES